MEQGSDVDVCAKGRNWTDATASERVRPSAASVWCDITPATIHWALSSHSTCAAAEIAAHTRPPLPQDGRSKSPDWASGTGGKYQAIYFGGSRSRLRLHLSASVIRLSLNLSGLIQRRYFQTPD